MLARADAECLLILLTHVLLQRDLYLCNLALNPRPSGAIENSDSSRLFFSATLERGCVLTCASSFGRSTKHVCGRRDLNPHVRRHRFLRPACLPFHHSRETHPKAASTLEWIGCEFRGKLAMYQTEPTHVKLKGITPCH